MGIGIEIGRLRNWLLVEEVLDLLEQERSSKEFRPC